MGTQRNTAQPSLLLPAVYCLVIIGLGLWVTLASGQWIAMICAVGLLVLPVRAYSARRGARSGDA